MKEPSNPLQRAVVLGAPEGLHLRPAAALVRAASRYRSDIRICHGEVSANAKSLMSLMMLEALPGAHLVLEALGPDAASALDGLGDLIASGRGLEEGVGLAPVDWAASA